MKTLTKFAGYLALVALMSTTLVLNSCKKEVYYKAKITVVNQANFPIQNAIVSTSAPCAGCTEGQYSGFTGLDGTVTFEFPAKMVLNVMAVKGTETGEGFIQLIEGQTVEEVVVIRP
jgi:hypothetical protein